MLRGQPPKLGGRSAQRRRHTPYQRCVQDGDFPMIQARTPPLLQCARDITLHFPILLPRRLLVKSGIVDVDQHIFVPRRDMAHLHCRASTDASKDEPHLHRSINLLRREMSCRSL